jgi:hypothetical protein
MMTQEIFERDGRKLRPGDTFEVNGMTYTFIRLEPTEVVLRDRLGEFSVSINTPHTKG